MYPLSGNRDRGHRGRVQRDVAEVDGAVEHDVERAGPAIQVGKTLQSTKWFVWSWKIFWLY